ncbi:hypothetical protein AA23498_2622 [Acetobacter nitrogenifigens DSM 23921 = NBRC 105050]|nr:hypothetical protein AA23498_2622 [Acetobacter nitrogenifigens DSM 23921 = NBRC 105050]
MQKQRGVSDLGHQSSSYEPQVEVVFCCGGVTKIQNDKTGSQADGL